MAKQNNTGVYKLNTGYWGFRYVVMINGVRKEARKTKDEFGAPLKTKKDAIKARQAAIDQEHDFRKPKPTVRKTIEEVFQEYCENGRTDRAYRTIQKQDSQASIHIQQSLSFFRRVISLVLEYLSVAKIFQVFSFLFFNVCNAELVCQYLVLQHSATVNRQPKSSITLRSSASLTRTRLVRSLVSSSNPAGNRKSSLLFTLFNSFLVVDLNKA